MTIPELVLAGDSNLKGEQAMQIATATRTEVRRARCICEFGDGSVYVHGEAMSAESGQTF